MELVRTHASKAEIPLPQPRWDPSGRILTILLCAPNPDIAGFGPGRRRGRSDGVRNHATGKQSRIRDDIIFRDLGTPSIAQVGSNLTISVTLKVDNLTGQIDYILQQRIIVDVFVASAVLNGSVIPAKNATNLYSGSTWGPFNITLPLTETNTGLAKGASTNATVSVTLEDTVLYATPSNLVSPYGQSTEPAMQGSAGSLIVQNQVSSTNSTSTSPTSAAQTYLPYALLGSGVVLMLLAVFLPRGSRGSLANEKQ